MMRRLGMLSVALLWPLSAFAAGGAAEGVMRHADIDVSNIYSLQRGARNFVNYCAGCHSAKYVRYNRIGKDLKLDDDLLRDNLMFGVGKTGATIQVAMAPEDAENWFGAVPPDLSLTGRSRGSDWVYSFLHSFYVDENRPLGVNNKLLAGAAMPHVLADLQGLQKAVYEAPHDGGGEPVFTGFEQIAPGKLSSEEYDEFVRDLTNFISYMGEPIQVERRSLGVKVLAFLALLFVLAYALKKEYWKDVH